MTLRHIDISVMVLITADRLLAGVLTIRYKVVCTLSQAKRIVITSWCFWLIVVPSTILISYGCGRSATMSKAYHVLEWFYGLGLNSFFLAFATITYITLFVIFVRSRRRFSSQQQSVWHMFKNSNFYIAIILISSFLVFMVVPYIIYYGVFKTKVNKEMEHILFLIWTLSDTSDALTYVFLYKPVQRSLKAAFTTLCCKCRGNAFHAPSNDISYPLNQTIEINDPIDPLKWTGGEEFNLKNRRV